MTPLVDQTQEAFEDCLLTGKEETDDPTLNFLTNKYRLARGEFDVLMANIEQAKEQLGQMQSRLLALEGAVNSRVEDVRDWARSHDIKPLAETNPDEDQEKDHG